MEMIMSGWRKKLLIIKIEKKNVSTSRLLQLMVYGWPVSGGGNCGQRSPRDTAFVFYYAVIFCPEGPKPLVGVSGAEWPTSALDGGQRIKNPYTVRRVGGGQNTVAGARRP